jgi:hypothetical protein
MTTMEINDFTIDINMPPIIGYIYHIKNTINDKSYIGQTKCYKTRMEQHINGEGSLLILADLVRYGIKSFQFNVVKVIYEDNAIDNLEDHYIEEYDTLEPKGYNKCINREIVAHDSDVESPHDDILITAKYIYKSRNYKCFSIGQLSSARAYQTLINLRETITTTKLNVKYMNGFAYIKLDVESDTDYVKGKKYDLCLFYDEDNDVFVC